MPKCKLNNGFMATDLGDKQVSHNLHLFLSKILYLQLQPTFLSWTRNHNEGKLIMIFHDNCFCSQHFTHQPYWASLSHLPDETDERDSKNEEGDRWKRDLQWNKNKNQKMWWCTSTAISPSSHPVPTCCKLMSWKNILLWLDIN